MLLLSHWPLKFIQKTSNNLWGKPHEKVCRAADLCAHSKRQHWWRGTSFVRTSWRTRGGRVADAWRTHGGEMIGWTVFRRRRPSPKTSYGGLWHYGVSKSNKDLEMGFEPAIPDVSSKVINVQLWIQIDAPNQHGPTQTILTKAHDMSVYCVRLADWKSTWRPSQLVAPVTYVR